MSFSVRKINYYVLQYTCSLVVKSLGGNILVYMTVKMHNWLRGVICMSLVEFDLEHLSDLGTVRHGIWNFSFTILHSYSIKI